MAPPSTTPSYAPQAASTQASSADTLSESTINLKRELEVKFFFLWFCLLVFFPSVSLSSPQTFDSDTTVLPDRQTPSLAYVYLRSFTILKNKPQLKKPKQFEGILRAFSSFRSRIPYSVNARNNAFCQGIKRNGVVKFNKSEVFCDIYTK